MVVVTPFLVTEGQASPCSQRHFGLTMYCPGFTVTSLHTSLVLHAGSWDGMVYIFRLDLFYPFIYIWPFIVYSPLFSCYVPLALCTFQSQKFFFKYDDLAHLCGFLLPRYLCLYFFSFKSHGSEYHTQNY